MLTLACGLHDSDAGLAWQLTDQVPVLRSIFNTVVVTATVQTDATVLKELRRLGCRVTKRRSHAYGPGLTLREAVRHGHAAAGAGPMLFMDMDRALHWARTKPEEHARIAKRAANVEWFIGERSPRAYRTHQRALIETEALANGLLSKALGERRVHDFLAPCIGLSPAARETVLRLPTRRDFSLIGQWILALQKAGFRPTYARCDGMDWETPDQFRDLVKRLGGKAAFRASLDASPAEWEKRRKIARDAAHDIILLTSAAARRVRAK